MGQQFEFRCVDGSQLVAVHFDPHTDEATVWVDSEDKQRLRLLFTRRYVNDRLTDSKPYESNYVAAIRQHLPSLIPNVKAGLSGRVSELVF